MDAKLKNSLQPLTISQQIFKEIRAIHTEIKLLRACCVELKENQIIINKEN